MGKELLRPGDLILGIDGSEGMLCASLGFIVAVTAIDACAHVSGRMTCAKRLLILWLEPVSQLIYECDCSVLCTLGQIVDEKQPENITVEKK